MKKARSPDDILKSLSRPLKPIKLTKRDKDFFKKQEENWKKYCQENKEMFKKLNRSTCSPRCPHCQPRIKN